MHDWTSTKNSSWGTLKISKVWAKLKHPEPKEPFLSAGCRKATCWPLFNNQQNSLFGWGTILVANYHYSRGNLLNVHQHMVSKNIIHGFPRFIVLISSNHCWLANQQWAQKIPGAVRELRQDRDGTVLGSCRWKPVLTPDSLGAHPNNMNKKKQFHDLSTMIISHINTYHISVFLKNAGNAPAFKNMLRFNTSSRGCIGFTVDHETNLESKWIPIQQDNSTNPIKSNFQAVMANVILQTALSRVAGMRTQNLPLSYLQLGEHHDCQHASVFLIHVIMLLAQAPLKWPIHPVLHIVLADGSFNSFSVSWDSYSYSDWIEKCFNMFHIDHLSLSLSLSVYIYTYISISKRIPNGSRSSLCFLARMEGHFQSVLFKGHLARWAAAQLGDRATHPMVRSVTCLAMLRWHIDHS